jgi:hypothetical protein
MRNERDWIIPRGRLRAALLGVVALMAVAAPARSTVADRRIDIRGRITSLESAKADTGPKQLLGAILVEGVKDDDTSYDKAHVRIRSDTDVVAADGQPMQFAELAVGMMVEVGFSGPVAESYPVQASAAWVQVVTP